jgi:hypothetical protein
MSKNTINLAVMVLFILIVAAASFAIGFTISASTAQRGAFPVYSGSGDVWNMSGTDKNGVLIYPDQNTVCFPRQTATCDVNIVWNGTDFVINGT